MKSTRIRKKTRFVKPYNSKGRANIPGIKGKSGVYLIKNPAGELVYIGFSSSNLYKTLYRHFQSWNDPTQVRVTYPKTGYTVRVVLTSPGRAAKLERALIVKNKPKDNPLKYENYQLLHAEKRIEQDYESCEFTPLNEVPF